jgi:hypothetical protein
LLGIGVIAALILGLQIAAYAGPIGTAQGFEDDDGNLAPQAPINFDWNSFAPVNWLPSPSATPNRQADKVVNGFTFKGIEDWNAANADSAFAGGTKQDTNCATVGTGKAPNKDDLKRIYLATKTLANGDTYLDLAWVRIPQNTTSSSAHVGFEFNKGTTLCNPNQPNGLVQRTAGDMLIVYDFEGGATEPVITVRRWVTSGACEVGSSTAPCWGPAQNLTAAGFAEAEVNVGTSVQDQLTPPALSSTTGTSVTETLNDSEFGEAGINLTAANIIPRGSCESFGKAFGVSRSSGNSGTAAMKDIVGPANFNLQNCGTINIIKQTSPAGIDQNFDFTSAASVLGGTCTIGTTPETTPASFTLNDGADATDSLTCTAVPAGTYTVTEGADPAGFSFSDLSCTASGTGTSATPASGNATRTASITIAGGGTATCTYTNDQQLGAIEITKTRKHAAAEGTDPVPHPGVEFTVDGTTVTTDADGKACVDGLTFGSYDVVETVPDGYVADGATTQSVTVDRNASCDDDPFVGNTVSFSNTPLTNVTVSVDSQVIGGTASTMQCTDSEGNVSNGSTDATTGDGDLTVEDLLPTAPTPVTLTCTVTVDP